MNRSTFNKPCEHAPQADGLPLSFGGNFQDDPLMRRNLRKSHFLSNAACGAKVPNNYAPHTNYIFYGEKVNEDYLKNPADPNATKFNYTFSNQIMENRMKMWKKDPELHFLAYVREPVFESSIESTRIRKLGITFYTEDNSIMIRESKQPNSGIDQGGFLARQKVPKDGGSGSTGLYLIEDLMIGNTITVYGRDVVIVDCDNATRQYLREKGFDVPTEGLPWPDSEDHYNTSVVKQKLAQNPKRQIPTFDMENKRALESLYSGGQITKHHPEDVRCAQQFLATKIGQHLTFAALWDDRDKISGDLHHVAIHYYLENDTVEIVERLPDNSGKDGGPKLLVRQRIPKPGTDPTKVRFQHNTFGVMLKTDFMVATDFSIGQRVVIHGKSFLIYDADEFTRAYMSQEYGVELGEKLDVSEIENKGKKPPVQHFPPPHNGFGTEEDSLQNCKSLELRPPRFDAEKAWRERGKVMVFSATMVSNNPLDAQREFVITFHRASDEVEIGEKTIRNSGIIGGKFLQKGRHLKELPNGRKVHFTPDDFDVGKEVVVAGRRFLLTAMDDHSRKVVAGIEDDVTEERVKELVLLFRTLVSTKYLRVAEAFRAITATGCMTTADLVAFYRRSSCRVRDEEAARVVQHISPDGDGTVHYDAFLKFIDGSDGTSVMDAASNNTRSVKNVNMNLEPHFLTATATADVDNTRKQLVSLLLHKLEERRGTIQEVFRLMAGHSYNSRLSRSEFRKGLSEVLHINVTPKEKELLLSAVFDGVENEAGEITFKQFHEFVESH